MRRPFTSKDLTICCMASGLAGMCLSFGSYSIDYGHPTRGAVAMVFAAMLGGWVPFYWHAHSHDERVDNSQPEREEDEAE